MDSPAQLEIACLPITIRQYRGMILHPISIDLTDDMVEARIDELIGKVVEEEKVPNAARAGDVVVFSCQCHVSGGQLEDVRIRACRVRIGSGDLIEGFERKLIGHAAGEELSFILNFPHAHVNRSLRGRLARFRVKVLEVYRKPKPERTDEFVRGVSEFASLDELRDAVRAQMQAENEDEMRGFLHSQVRAKLAEIATVEVPDEVASACAGLALEQLRSGPGGLSAAFAEGGLSEAESMQALSEKVRCDIVATRALLEIARREGLEAEDRDALDEAEEALCDMGASPDEAAALLSDADTAARARESVLVNRAMEFVIAHAVMAPDGRNAADED